MSVREKKNRETSALFFSSPEKFLEDVRKPHMINKSRERESGNESNIPSE